MIQGLIGKRLELKDILTIQTTFYIGAVGLLLLSCYFFKDAFKEVKGGKIENKLSFYIFLVTGVIFLFFTGTILLVALSIEV